MSMSMLDNPASEKNKTVYLPLISMLYVTSSLATYLLAYKLAYVQGILISAGIFIFPFTYFFGAILAEAYDFATAKRIIYYATLCQAIFVCLIYFLIKLPSPSDWHLQTAYDAVLGPVLWFFISNATGVFVGSYVNVFIISKWRVLVKGKYFVIRCATSSFIGEAVTSIIADLMAFSGRMSHEKLVHMMLAIYAVKVIYAIVLAYPAKWISALLKRIECRQKDYNSITLLTGEKKDAFS